MRLSIQLDPHLARNRSVQAKHQNDSSQDDLRTVTNEYNVDVLFAIKSASNLFITAYNVPFPYISASVSSSTSADCSFATASASLEACFFSPAVGLLRPDDGAGDALPLFATFSDLSTALAATTLAAFSAGALSVFAAAGAGVSGIPSDSTLAFGAGASFPIDSTLAFGVAASPPMDRTFALGAGASPPILSTLGAPSFRVTGVLSAAEVAAGPAEPSAGRLAICGVCDVC